ncbi:FRG domain-containing protein [Sphingomonas adhaesiva]|uniref:FRG domain-containing protein n=1 Tax=Sphingomonas adhaesiva TaxID=28212 RepID=UPI002FF5662C
MTILFNTGLQLIGDYLRAVSVTAWSDSILRGHANRDWQVTPSAFRPGVNGIRTQADLEGWKNAARRFVDRPQSDLEWLVLAQHYGIATPLVDWTTNPLVALFFACQNSVDSFGLRTNGSVVAVPRHAMWSERLWKKVDLFEPWNGPPMLVPSETMNRRTLAQESVMTLHTHGNHQLLPDKDVTIWNVEAHMKGNIRLALSRLGISAERLYADINTVAREYIDTLEVNAWAAALPKPPVPQT